MPRLSLINQLDQAIEVMLAQPGGKSPEIDSSLTPLLRVAIVDAADDERINPFEVQLVEIPKAARVFLRSFNQQTVVCSGMRRLRCRPSRNHRC